MAYRKYAYLVIPRDSENADLICTRYLKDGRARIIVLNPNRAPWAEEGEQKSLIYYITIEKEAITENSWEEDLKLFQMGKQKYHVDPGERFSPAKGWLFEIKNDDEENSEAEDEKQNEQQSRRPSRPSYNNNRRPSYSNTNRGGYNSRGGGYGANRGGSYNANRNGGYNTNRGGYNSRGGSYGANRGGGYNTNRGGYNSNNHIGGYNSYNNGGYNNNTANYNSDNNIEDNFDK